jgi:hypothetical protein
MGSTPSAPRTPSAPASHTDLLGELPANRAGWESVAVNVHVVIGGILADGLDQLGADAADAGAGNLADSAASTARSSIRAARAQRSPRQAPLRLTDRSEELMATIKHRWRGWYSTGLRPRRSTGAAWPSSRTITFGPRCGSAHSKLAVLQDAMRQGVRPQDLPTHYAGEIAEFFDTLAERLEPCEGLGPGPIPLGAAFAAAR